MTTPVNLPICWEPSRIEKAISIKAKLDEKQTDYFLACHSPIANLQDNKTGEPLNEEEFYQRLINPRQRDVQGVVFGDAGTGKSHLIHWLKLRADDGIQRGEISKAVTILIERRSGSLKDALEQLIQQLMQNGGGDFERFLTPVREAFSRISDATARQKLILEMATELGPRWKDRQRPELSRRLQHLGQACRAEGFGKWLSRDGGVVARIINLLTEASTSDERSNRPRFTDADLRVDPRYCSHKENSEQVVALLEELEDSQKLRTEAAEVLNTALDSAVVELTGLSGANLRKVFDQVRLELQRKKQRMLLFIEDVSTMAELDSEVFNALEPQDRSDLCPMTAILGMTRAGFGLLRDNQKTRLQFQVSFGQQSANTWLDDPEKLAEFTARYLNALRLPEDRIRTLADQRRLERGDVSISKCTDCPVRESCHELFGKVSLQGVDVGLYPLSVSAPHALLERLNVDAANAAANAISRTPRGFLIHLLKPLVDNQNAIKTGSFPDLTTLPVRSTDPSYWTQFQQQYCGDDWSETDRARLRSLALFWIPLTDSADDAALSLAPLLEPLKFRKFSRTTKKSGPGKKKGGGGTLPPPPPPPPDKINSLLQQLRDWLDQGRGLRSAGDFRDWLLQLVRDSIPWDEYGNVPTSEVNRRLAKRDVIEIQDQGVAPGNFSIKFPRTEEMRALLEALARFHTDGRKSWDFEGGSIHRRIVSRWVRNQSVQVMQQLQPPMSGGSTAPITSATQFLCLASLIRRRKRLPNANAEILPELLMDSFPESPSALSRRWKTVMVDLKARVNAGDIRKVLLDEVAVTQGRSVGINFIDPREIVKAAQSFRNEPRIDTLDEEYGRGLWKSRFFGFDGLNAYQDLAGLVEDEREEIRRQCDEVRQFLETQQYDTKNISEAWKQFCSELRDLATAAKETEFFAPALVDLIRDDVFSIQSTAFGENLDDAMKISMESDIIDVIVFDSGPLLKIVEAIGRASEQLGRIEQNLSAQETEMKEAGGDPIELHGAMIQALTAFEAPSKLDAVSVESEEAEDDSDD